MTCAPNCVTQLLISRTPMAPSYLWLPHPSCHGGLLRLIHGIISLCPSESSLHSLLFFLCLSHHYHHHHRYLVQQLPGFHVTDSETGNRRKGVESPRLTRAKKTVTSPPWVCKLQGHVSVLRRPSRTYHISSAPSFISLSPMITGQLGRREGAPLARGPACSQCWFDPSTT